MKTKAQQKDRVKTNKNNRASIKRPENKKTNKLKRNWNRKQNYSYIYKNERHRQKQQKPTYKINERTKQRKRAKWADKIFVQNSLTWSLTVLKVFRIFVCVLPSPPALCMYWYVYRYVLLLVSARNPSPQAEPDRWVQDAQITANVRK